MNSKEILATEHIYSHQQFFSQCVSDQKPKNTQNIFIQPYYRSEIMQVIKTKFAQKCHICTLIFNKDDIRRIIYFLSRFVKRVDINLRLSSCHFEFSNDAVIIVISSWRKRKKIRVCHISIPSFLLLFFFLFQVKYDISKICNIRHYICL